MTVNSPRPPDLPGLRFVGPVECGDGGYATVFKYEQLSTRRMVAVKVLRENGVGRAQFQAMLAEATAMAVLETHPHMVPVFEARMSEDGQACIIMMFCGGPNLMTLVDDRNAPDGRPRYLNVRRVVRLGIQIAGVVQAAHEKRLVHRDIKPANILTDDRDCPRLTDFGIAGRLGTAETDVQFGHSLPWCPPEVLAGKPAGVASDLFSFGATLWHLLAGRSPFDVPGNNLEQELKDRIADPRPPWTGRQDVPPELEQLLSRLMAREIGRRPSTAREVVAELTRLEKQIGEPRPGEPWHTERPIAFRAAMSGEKVATADRTQPRNPIPDQVPNALPEQTKLRPHKQEPQAQVEPKAEPRTSPRWVWVAGAVVSVSALTGLLLLQPWAQPSQRPSTVDTNTDAGGGAGSQADNLPPGKPEITATRADARTLRFTWTYSSLLDSDTYLWRLSTSDRPQAADQPVVEIKSPAGSRVCIVVKVVRADGSYGTVSWSDEGCGS